MSFHSETVVRAVRKPKPCEGCGRTIKAGERATRWTGNQDGFYTCLYHPECRRAEVKLNALHETHQVWAEWMPLSDIEWDDWPWLIAECPLAAVYMRVTAAEYEAVRAEQERVRLAWLKIYAERRVVSTPLAGSLS